MTRAAIAYLAPSLPRRMPAVRRLLGLRDRTASGQGVALTFDDGPHPEGTPAVLQILAAAGVPATFFLVGEQVERHPEVAAAIVAAGHEVAIHCHRHLRLTRFSAARARADLERARAAIVEATGVEPRLYRPPYGLVNAAALAHASGQGWEVVLWAREGHDWEASATPESITRRLTRNLRAGDVLLLHDADSWRKTVAALPLLLEALEQQGLEPTTI